MTGSDLRGVLDGSGAKPGHHEGDVGASGGVREHQVGAGTKEGGESGCGDAEGARVFAVEQVNGLIALRYIDEVVRDQALAIEGRLVAHDTKFVFDTALDEIIDDAGQAALGHLAQVIDIDRAIYVHGCVSPSS